MGAVAVSTGADAGGPGSASEMTATSRLMFRKRQSSTEFTATKIRAMHAKVHELWGSGDEYRPNLAKSKSLTEEYAKLFGCTPGVAFHRDGDKFDGDDDDAQYDGGDGDDVTEMEEQVE